MNPGGELDFQQLMAAAAQVQSQLSAAQQELTEVTAQGTAGGGLVTATVNGSYDLIDLTISGEALESDSALGSDEIAETVADMVLAAVRAAHQVVEQRQQEAIGPFAAGLSGMLGGGLPGLPGLGGLPGSSAPGDDDTESEDAAGGDGAGGDGAGGDGAGGEVPGGT